jgi:hypothetical protein
MPFSAFPSLIPSQRDVVRSALMTSLHEEHRPELADLIESAEILVDRRGVWVRPATSFSSLSASWLEPRLLAAAVRGGLPVEWVRVVSGPDEAAVESSQG